MKILITYILYLLSFVFKLKTWQREGAVKHRNARQDVIRELVRRESVRTQRDLVNMLRNRGFNCTQATVSRDTAEMDLQKLPEGAYVLSEDMYLQKMLSEFVVSIRSAENLIIIHCHPATASAVAFALDEVQLEHVMGTVAGDDTILLVVDRTENASEVARILVQLGNAN